MKKFIIPFLIIFIAFIVGIGSGFLVKNNNTKTNIDNSNEDKLQVTKIPYVKEGIGYNDTINLYNIGYQEVPKDLINEEIITSLDKLYNSSESMCIKKDVFIPQNSFLYKDQITSCDGAGNIFNFLDSNYYPFLLEVSSGSRKLIKDNSYIDIKINTIYEGKRIDNVIIENTEVIKRYDDKDNVINDDNSDTYKVLVALPNDYHKILEEAKISKYTLTAIYKSDDAGDMKVSDLFSYDLIRKDYYQFD